MPQNYENERPMENQPGQPEPFSSPKNWSAFPYFYLAIPEKGAEKYNFQDHPADHSEGIVGVIKKTNLYPRQGLLLTTGSRNPKRDGRFGPAPDPPNKADQKYQKSCVWNNYSKKIIIISPSYANQRKEDKKR